MLKWINSNLNKIPTLDNPKDPTPLPLCFETDNLPGKILDMEFQCESEEASRELIASLTFLYTVRPSPCSKLWSTTRETTTQSTGCTRSACSTS